MSNATTSQKEFYIKVNKEYIRISLSDIDYFKGKGNYCKIFTGNRSYIIHSKMTDILAILPGDDFCRIHKSFIINMRKVDKFNANCVVVSGVKLSIGITYRSQIADRVLILNEPTPGKVLKSNKSDGK